MPFTPYHFGINALVALPFKKYIDPLVFILATVAIDLEPLSVMLFDLEYPLHGYNHTLLIGALTGTIWALAANAGKNTMEWMKNILRLDYDTNLKKMLVSGVMGAWFHVLLDAPLYSDIRPFYPSEANPLFGTVSGSSIYLFCTISFIPAIIVWVFLGHRKMK